MLLSVAKAFFLCSQVLVTWSVVFWCFPVNSPSQVASILFPERTIDRKTPQDTYRHSVAADPWSTASFPSHVTTVYVYSYLISGPTVTPYARINSVKLTMSTSHLSRDLLQAPPQEGQRHPWVDPTTCRGNSSERMEKLCLVERTWEQAFRSWRFEDESQESFLWPAVMLLYWRFSERNRMLHL